MIPGISSQHDNHHEDRKFFFTICELRPRCTELVKVKYDDNFIVTNKTKVILAKKTMNNNDDFMKPWNPSYSSDESEGQVPFRSYSFERTEGHEMFVR
jgi:hypothetical protein